MNDLSSHIVIDNGAFSCKIGYNGENAPRSVLHSFVGEPYDNFNLLKDLKKEYIGKSALINTSTLALRSPFGSNGNIRDFNIMEKIWRFLFYEEMKVAPEAHNVFITEPLYSSNDDRAKMAEIMFEKFNVFNLHIEPQAPMTLYSTAKTSGLIIESGECQTHVIPVYETYIVNNGVCSTNIAGKVLNDVLIDLLRDPIQKYKIDNLYYHSMKIKENYSKIQNTCLKEEQVREKLNELKLNSRSDITYQLPDGNEISLGEIPNIFNEVIYHPELFGFNENSLVDCITSAIDNIDITLRKEMLSNVILGGGTTMITNYAERLKNELNQEYQNKNLNIKIIAQNERNYSAWIGASVLCSIGNFQNLWISKNEYEECGPSKFFRETLY